MNRNFLYYLLAILYVSVSSLCCKANDNKSMVLNYTPDHNHIPIVIPTRSSLIKDERYYATWEQYQVITWGDDSIGFCGGNVMHSISHYRRIPYIHTPKGLEIDISERRKDNVLKQYYTGLALVNKSTDTVPVSCWNNGEYLTINDLLYVKRRYQIDQSKHLPPFSRYFQFFFLNMGLSFIVQEENNNPFIFKSKPFTDVEVTVTFNDLSVMKIQYKTKDTIVCSERYAVDGDFNFMSVTKLLSSDYNDSICKDSTYRLGGKSGLAGKRVCFWSENEIPLEYMVIDNILFANTVRIPEIKDLKMSDINDDYYRKKNEAIEWDEMPDEITQYIEYNNLKGVHTSKFLVTGMVE